MLGTKDRDKNGKGAGEKRRRKRVYWGYSILDYKGMEAYFEKMAREGWMLEKIGELWATFYRETPKDLQFTIDVFERSGILTPEETEEAREYRELCEKNGWHFVTSIKELQIFHAPANEDLTPIQTDEELEESLARKKVWKKDFSTSIIVFLLTAVLVIITRVRPAFQMDEYMGNIIYFLYPLMLIPTMIALIRSLLWIRKVKRQGLPEKEAETFFTGRRRKLLIDIIAALVTGFLILGVVLDTLYNPHANTISSIFPALLGITAGTIIRLTIQKKGRNKDDGIRFVIIGFLVMFMILGGFNYYRERQIENNIGDRDPNLIEEIPEDITTYSIEEVLVFTEEKALKRRTFPVLGQSFAVPKHYTQHQTWEVEGRNWEITIRTYETRNAWVAERIAEGYLDFQMGGIITWFGENWRDMEDLREAWDVDGFYMTEGYPAILMKQDTHLWIIEGNYRRVDNYIEEIKEPNMERLIEEILEKHHYLF
ncbi:DUF2812 domain-containing protein [Isachenkonia alkalipeptolytica]|uniref:DUF2812 domain-containing protein n=1 Tax=Isachenkonia alkalipeptolytica TaxID=2565777 RepID=A0AA43XND4_9CLOT|nr:DUF2812 domain-containing protein [Isachenkonia alkalipeptolytica]NBG89586.1 DUF2812 domain-containing protein [Isachenkonia alkalipeptolytica]